MKNPPLAHKMRPRNLEEFIGQEHLLGKNKPIRVAIENRNLPSSIILWGPPGCGKTTLAKLISRLTDCEFIETSAVSAGKEDIKKAINKASLFNKKTILFLDEIHRFNKAQQDFLLPYVENGTIFLIGATTENPSFEVISALLSRSRVYILEPLTEDLIEKIILNALKDERGLNKKAELREQEIRLIAQLSNGDARAALNILELAYSLAKKSEDDQKTITEEDILNSAQKTLRYDKDGEEHYNIISALHKSMRDSDVQASIYWTMRMIEGGEDPKYIVRRMIRFASEDIGNADIEALKLAIAVKDTIMFLGMPESNVALVQLAIYLAKAPKSNAAYEAVQKARETIKKTGNLPVPLHLRNAPTRLMKEIGYGAGYKYAHNYKNAKVEQEHLPEKIKNEKWFDEEKDRK